jgi:uncharacterized protein YdcH (DUF465 family)
MNTLEKADPYFANAQAEHQELRHMVAELKTLFDDRRREEAAAKLKTAKLQAALVERLTHLRDRVAEHFAPEEQGGYLEEALSRLPRLSHEADVLLSQHAPLAAQLEAIVKRARAADKTPRDWAALETEFIDFTEKLAAHDAGETQILESAFNEELQ